MITQERLKELLHYNPDTGSLVWRVDKARAKVGDEVGHICERGRTHYRETKIDGIHYKTHRLAWMYIHGKFPERHIDHIDHNGLNNRIENLREVTVCDNQRNARLRSDNSSGVTGVSFNKALGKWGANIRVKSKLKHIGYFIEIRDAISARKAAEGEYKFHENHGKE